MATSDDGRFRSRFLPAAEYNDENDGCQCRSAQIKGLDQGFPVRIRG